MTDTQGLTSPNDENRITIVIPEDATGQILDTLLKSTTTVNGSSTYEVLDLVRSWRQDTAAPTSDDHAKASSTAIPREAVDAAARGLGNHINVDFDLLNATDQLAARETALAALNPAAPLILAGKDAEIERLRDALISIEYAAERADRKGYDLDTEDVLDSVRRGLGKVTSTEAGA